MQQYLERGLHVGKLLLMEAGLIAGALGGVGIKVHRTVGVDVSGATNPPALPTETPTSLSPSADCFMDTRLGSPKHNPGTPPHLYFEVLNSCAEDGELGHFDYDTTIDGYTKVVLDHDVKYLDGSGQKRTFQKGTTVYYPDGSSDIE